MNGFFYRLWNPGDLLSDGPSPKFPFFVCLFNDFRKILQWGFFFLFFSFFFPPQTAAKRNFSEEIKNFTENEKIFGAFFAFSGFLAFSLVSFPIFDSIFFHGQTERKRNFSKKIKKIRLKSKIFPYLNFCRWHGKLHLSVKSLYIEWSPFF